MDAGYEHKIVGYLVGGCQTSTTTPVYRVNIGIYSQTCHVCGKLVVDGVKSAKGKDTPLELYDKEGTREFMCCDCYEDF